MLTLNMSLSNSQLYQGCEITEIGGRQTLVTKPDVAANIIGRNCMTIVEATPAEKRDKVVLTGPMAVWAYLVIFHQVVHKFNQVVYDDGRNGTVLVAQH